LKSLKKMKSKTQNQRNLSCTPRRNVKVLAAVGEEAAKQNATAI
jgi:hypothetical protein